MRDIRDYSLLSRNTFGIDVKCRRFIDFDTVEEIQRVVPTLTEEDRPLLLLGGGSNLLLTKDFEGTVLHVAIKGVERHFVDGGILLRCGAGETWDDIVALCVKNEWYGAENLSLIPGEVGASAVQNIGAYGSEVKDIIYKVEAVEIKTGLIHWFTNEECDYHYRQSRFKHDWKDRFLITHVTYRLQESFTPNLDYGNIREELRKEGIENPTAQQLRDCIIRIRDAKLPDPKKEGNAGSFFMNPIVEKAQYDELRADYPDMPHYVVDDDHVKIPAGWMIDRCGWKGKSLGRAGVHSKQALVLVNRGGATGEEVVALCEQIRKDVKQKFGVDIHPEVNVV
ncbi:MAG: UDP-N-acetylmuramate dehydrogenase [Prevotella sp.]|nr:UDP-N-acetylmuramate dehydrogenase [Prevotella sp.]